MVWNNYIIDKHHLSCKLKINIINSLIEFCDYLSFYRSFNKHLNDSNTTGGEWVGRWISDTTRRCGARRVSPGGYCRSYNVTNRQNYNTGMTHVPSASFLENVGFQTDYFV